MRSGFMIRLRQLNISRRLRWHDANNAVEWTGADWSNAMCGEAGEAANVVKKLRRHDTGLGEVSANTPEREELLTALEDEIADIIIYADLLADHYGLDTLDCGIVRKFNEVSARHGFPERLEHR